MAGVPGPRRRQPRHRVAGPRASRADDRSRPREASATRWTRLSRGSRRSRASCSSTRASRHRSTTAGAGSRGGAIGHRRALGELEPRAFGSARPDDRRAAAPGLGDKGSAARGDHRAVRPARRGGAGRRRHRPRHVRRRRRLRAAGRLRAAIVAVGRADGRSCRRWREAADVVLAAPAEARRAAGPAQRVSSARSSSWRRSHHVMSSRSTPRRRSARRRRRSSAGMASAVASASAVPTTSAGATARAPLGHLVERAGGLGQDEHRVALGDDDRLLGDEVHAVDQRVDEHDVGDREAGQGLGVVVLVEQLDGRQPARPNRALMRSTAFCTMRP